MRDDNRVYPRAGGKREKIMEHKCWPQRAFWPDGNFYPWLRRRIRHDEKQANFSAFIPDGSAMYE